MPLVSDDGPGILSAEIITAKIKASPDKFDASPTTLGGAGVGDLTAYNKCLTENGRYAV